MFLGCIYAYVGVRVKDCEGKLHQGLGISRMHVLMDVRGLMVAGFTCEMHGLALVPATLLL